MAVAFELPGRMGPVVVVRHARAARRLRVEVPGLRHQPALARRLERELAARADVVRAQAEPATGRLVIEYREAAELPRWLLQVPEPARSEGWSQRAARWLRGARRGPAHAAAAPEAAWHALSTREVLARLGTSADGLASAEATRRLAHFGDNLLEAVAPRSRLAMLAAQVANLPAVVLVGSSMLSAALGDLVDAAAILSVVGLNTAIGYTIERKNEDLLASWRRLEAGSVEVVRDATIRSVPAAEIVPGDLLVCRAGDRVPADARVVAADRLSCDEAALTGESEPAAKHPAPVAAEAALAERSSTIYAGTSVVSGHGRAVVVATGASTEVARIRELVERERAPETPLERRMRQLGTRVTVLSLGASAAAAVAGLLHGRSPGRVLRSAVALGVAAIPEGLPVVSTAALVRSMLRLRESGVIVRRLASAETLGGVTVICADKTGTLTENDMRLEVLEVGDGPLDLATLRARADAPSSLEDPATLALVAAVLNSDVELRGAGRDLSISGSATERALVTAARSAGLDVAALRRSFPRRLLRERGDGLHYVVSVHDAPDGRPLSFVKGAPEQVLELCDRDFAGPLTPPRRERMLARNAALADAGLRVLGLAWRRETAWDDYTFIGLAGLRDPVRASAAETVRNAARAGIRTIVLTGDQLRTAAAIARQVGLEGEAMDGGELARALEAGDPEAHARLARVAVLSRVTPADKLAVVRALRARGELVAMAGDGVNDAPALRAADVGIAVGSGATDLARQVADVVLEGGDLRSIVAAVGEGRIVQDNLRHALRFLFATNLSEMALVLGAALIGAREPLTPLQLLWINLLTDTLPALALALEPGQPEVLDRPPAPPSAQLLPAAATRRVVRDGLLLGTVGAVGFVAGGPPVAFGALTAAQLAYVTQCRSSGAPPDRRFAGLVGGALAMQAAMLTLSPLRGVLRMGPVSTLEALGFVSGLTLPILVGGLSRHEVIVRKGNAPEVLR